MVQKSKLWIDVISYSPTPYAILHTPYFLIYTLRMTRKELSKFKLPDGPGVYIFKGQRGKILYIGKATSLRDRVRSYFSANLTEARSSAIAGMIEEAKYILWKTTGSVLESLILEANLIKKYQPKYNSRDKDNKSFNYLVITKESASWRTPAGGFPRVLVVRGRELFSSPLNGKRYSLFAIYGPYPQGRSLADALKIVRKIFPFRDSCTPCTSAEMSQNERGRPLKSKNIFLRYSALSLRVSAGCKPCFNRQIGLCPGVCSGEIDEKEYSRTIKNIRELFSGNFHGLKRRLAKEMREASKSENFEEALKLRRQISALEHVRDVSLIKEGDRISAGGHLSNMNDLRSRSSRIEAYDMAHTSGSETVAVMTIVANGEPEKESYRKFKIKSVQNDDVGALREVLSRRLAHNEWPLPRVFVVDGGLSQLRAAKNLLKDAGLMIPVVGVVKNEFHKPERMIGDLKLIESYGKDILLANGEAHRFAIKYHRYRLRARP